MKTISFSWPSSRVTGTCIAAHGIEARADAAGKPNAAQGRGVRRRAVAAEELGAVAGHRADRLAAVDEDDPVGELGVVRVAGEQRAADRVDLGHHVHQRFVAQLAQHQFPVAGHRQLTRPAGAVGDLEANELDRRVGGDVEAQLGDDAVLGILEDAVAEAVAGDIRVLAAGRAGATATRSGRSPRRGGKAPRRSSR